jgi:hypothetical protein
MAYRNTHRSYGLPLVMFLTALLLVISFAILYRIG